MKEELVLPITINGFAVELHVPDPEREFEFELMFPLPLPLKVEYLEGDECILVSALNSEFDARATEMMGQTMTTYRRVLIPFVPGDNITLTMDVFNSVLPVINDRGQCYIREVYELIKDPL